MKPDSTPNIHDLSQYLIGIEEIDSDHMAIADLLIKFRDKPAGLSIDKREELLNQLVSLSEHHLANEGAMMTYYHYPHEESHTIENLRLIRLLKDLSPISGLKEIENVISEFLHHTDTYDRLFAFFVINKRSRRVRDQYHDIIL